MNRKATPMTKKILCNSRQFGVIIAAILIMTCFGFSVSASSGSHIYRASISPRSVSMAPAESQAKVHASSTKKAPAKQKAVASTKAPTKKAPATVRTPSPTTSKKKNPALKSSVANKKQEANKISKSVTSKKNALPADKSRGSKKQSAPVAAQQTSPAKKSAATIRKSPPPAPAKIAAVDQPKDLHLNVKAAILINMTNGKVYYEQNPDKAIPPASITKLLTLFLVREAMRQGRLSPDTPIPVRSRAVLTGGSRMSLKTGEKVPLGELIKGISVVSANNACVAVAEYLGKGDPNRFVSQMNSKARNIGMANSKFKNPNGLPAPGQLSTARDIAKLSTNYLRTFPESLSVHSMTTHTFHGATHRNANSLLRTYKGVDGLKTGFVCASGYNITATARRGNTRLVAVVLGAQNSIIRQVETARLLDYGFKRAALDDGLGNRAASQSKKDDV